MASAFKSILILSAVDRMSTVVNRALGGAQTKLDKFGGNAQRIGKSMMTASAGIAAPPCHVHK